jgi:hypothetical protein
VNSITYPGQSLVQSAHIDFHLGVMCNDMGEKSKIDLQDDFDIKDETNFTDTTILRDEITRKLKMLSRISKLERQIENNETEDAEALGDTSVVKTYKFVQKRVGLKKLVSDRFTKK